MTLKIYHAPDSTPGWGEFTSNVPPPVNPVHDAYEDGKREGFRLAALLAHTTPSPISSDVPPLTWRAIQNAADADDPAPVGQILRDVVALTQEGIQNRLRQWLKNQPQEPDSDFQLQLKGVEWYCVLAEVENWARCEVEEGVGSEERRATLTEFRSLILQMCEQRGLKLGDD